MKYLLYPFKQIEFGDIEALKVNDYVDTESVPTLFTSPVIDNKVFVQVTWRYRLYHNTVHIFSYVGESKCELMLSEILREDVPLLVTNLFFQFSNNWEENFRGTDMQGTPMIGLTPAQFDELVGDITALLK